MVSVKADTERIKRHISGIRLVFFIERASTLNPYALVRLLCGAAFLSVFALLVCANPASAQKPNLSSGLQVTASTDARAMATALLGPGVHIVGTPTLVGSSDSSGTQQGFFDTFGSDVVGFKNGIVLSSGYASNIVGPNQSPAQSKV